MPTSWIINKTCVRWLAFLLLSETELNICCILLDYLLVPRDQRLYIVVYLPPFDWAWLLFELSDSWLPLNYRNLMGFLLSCNLEEYWRYLIDPWLWGKIQIFATSCRHKQYRPEPRQGYCCLMEVHGCVRSVPRLPLPETGWTCVMLRLGRCCGREQRTCRFLGLNMKVLDPPEVTVSFPPGVENLLLLLLGHIFLPLPRWPLYL